MDLKDLFRYVSKSQEYIESHVPSIWQKFVKGVNMSYIDCTYGPFNKVLPKFDHKFHIIEYTKAVSTQLVNLFRVN